MQLLHYIFTYATKIYNSEPYCQDPPNFLLNLAIDISKLDTTNDEESKKAIDLAFSSAIPSHITRKGWLAE